MTTLKVVDVLAYVCLGISIAAQVDDLRATQSVGNGAPADQIEETLVQETHIIQGDVLRVEVTRGGGTP